VIYSKGVGLNLHEEEIERIIKKACEKEGLTEDDLKAAARNIAEEALKMSEDTEKEDTPFARHAK
jgi:transcriptional regulator NrdR family protein